MLPPSVASSALQEKGEIHTYICTYIHTLYIHIHIYSKSEVLKIWAELVPADWSSSVGRITDVSV